MLCLGAVSPTLVAAEPRVVSQTGGGGLGSWATEEHLCVLDLFNVSFQYPTGANAWVLSLTQGKTYGGVPYTSQMVLVAWDDPVWGEVDFVIKTLNYSSPMLMEFSRLLCSSEMFRDGRRFLRTIDGRESVILILGPVQEFYIQYSLDSDSWVDPDGEFTGDADADRNATLAGSSFVTIEAWGDWDVVEPILSSIHVEPRSPQGLRKPDRD